MPLAGMLAAGAGTGLRTASNLNTQAANELEIRDRREMLRMQFLEHQYQQGRADSMADAKNNAILREAEYKRTREDKLADAESKHNQSKELIGIQESGRNARTAASNDARIKSALLRKEGSTGGSAGKGSLTLPNGQVFTANSPEYRLAIDMVNSGKAPDLQTAIDIVISKGILGQAAQNPIALKEGSPNVARGMTRQLFGNDLVPQATPGVRKFNPETRKFE